MSKQTFYLSIWSLNPTRFTSLLSLMKHGLLGYSIQQNMQKQEGGKKNKKQADFFSSIKECCEKEMVILKVQV